MAIFELTHQEVEKGHYFFVIALKKGGLIIFREPMKENEKVKKKKETHLLSKQLALNQPPHLRPAGLGNRH